jgi:hypothetical protein
MNEGKPGIGPTRAGVLKRGLLLLGGIVGVGAGAAGTKAALDEPSTSRTLRLTGRNWILQTQERIRGERVRPGDRGTVTGELVDGRGRKSGHFVGTRMAVASGLASNAHADGSIELHTFILADGTILGMGSALPGSTVFSIVGGSGRFAGARGTYVAEQRLRELGGDGTASFTFDLSA